MTMKRLGLYIVTPLGEDASSFQVSPPFPPSLRRFVSRFLKLEDQPWHLTLVVILELKHEATGNIAIIYTYS